MGKGDSNPTGGTLGAGKAMAPKMDQYSVMHKMFDHFGGKPQNQMSAPAMTGGNIYQDYGPPQGIDGMQKMPTSDAPMPGMMSGGNPGGMQAFGAPPDPNELLRRIMMSRG